MERVQNKIAWALVVTLSLLVMAALAGVVRGGPLDPPAPVGPTGKNVITSLPFTISQPGSYVLNGNLTCTACSGGQSGINVNASQVTIDLQGFELQGVPGSLHGIDDVAAPNAESVTIKNGTIKNWDGIGVFIAPTGTSTTIDGIHASGNDYGGLVIGAGIIRNCRVHQNGGNGIQTTGDATIR